MLVSCFPPPLSRRVQVPDLNNASAPASVRSVLQRSPISPPRIRPRIESQSSNPLLAADGLDHPRPTA
ncbi:MAG: hypothetical protein EOO65_04185 [Methanosarcinales archaeon]|nr:MAG: hypothetical protein EOO65_04185 [Methanosarcinales archaeon]